MNIRIAISVVLWFLLIVLLDPFPPLRASWIIVLLGWALLVLIPLLSPTGGYPVALLAGGMAVLALTLPPSLQAALLTLPWMLLAFLRTWRKWRGGYSLKLLAGIYWLVGTAWLTATAAGLQPLNFDPLIVLLTAVHFHYAGYLLTLLAGVLVAQKPQPRDRFLKIALLGGVPLVATGITVGHLEGPPLVEILAVLWMTVTVVLVLRKAIRTMPRSVLTGLGALLLGSGMVLACLYGLRSLPGLPHLSIPGMYALHGSLNTVGLTLLWAAVKRN